MMTFVIIPVMTIGDLLGEPLKRRRGTLSAKDVQQVMRIAPALLQQWLARGLVPFTAVKAGGRTWRRFDIHDLPRLVLISELVGQGLLIGEVVGIVPTILNWRYQRGSEPNMILWFRQIDLIVFATPSTWLHGIFREQGCASCILLNADELKRKVKNALTFATNDL